MRCRVNIPENRLSSFYAVEIYCVFISSISLNITRVQDIISVSNYCKFIVTPFRNMFKIVWNCRILHFHSASSVKSWLVIIFIIIWINHFVTQINNKFLLNKFYYFLAQRTVEQVNYNLRNERLSMIMRRAKYRHFNVPIENALGFVIKYRIWDGSRKKFDFAK